MAPSVSLAGLHPVQMLPRVKALLADPEFKALGGCVISAFRPIEKQRELFARAVRKYGSEAKARKWVAPPGKSRHGPVLDGCGMAVDIKVNGVKAVSGQWPSDIEAKVNTICARHGLVSPMQWEDWHFEPIANWKPAAKPKPPAPKPAVAKPKPLTRPFPGPVGVGSKNTTAVVAIQRVLHLADDGDYGPKTKAAVVKFQKANGIPATGTVDLKTWATLFAAKKAA